MGRKNLKVPEALFLALRDDKPDRMTWPLYLERECLDDPDVSQPSDITNELDGLLTAKVGDTVDYDDIVTGCREAIREELPVERMKR